MNVFTRLRTWLHGQSKSSPATPKGSLGKTPQARPTQTTVGNNIPVGTLVIGCPNEWQPMVVGTITGYDERFGNIPFIADWIRGEELMCFSPLTIYSDEAFSVLVLMNPYERYNFVSLYSAVEMDKPKRGEDLTMQDYLARVGVGLAKHETRSMSEPTM